MKATNSVYKWFAVLLTSFVLSGATAVSAANELAPKELAPKELVSQLFQEMNSRLQADKVLIAADRNHLLALGDQVLGPYVSFDKMAKQVLGKHWRKITPDQQQRYTSAFKSRVSYSMVSKYDANKKYSLKLLGERRNKKGNRAVVKSEVKSLASSGKHLIDYKFYLNKKTNEWQVYDVIVEGISVLQSFKSASADEIKKFGIEKLIQQLELSPTDNTEKSKEKEEATAGAAIAVKAPVVAVMQEKK